MWAEEPDFCDEWILGLLKTFHVEIYLRWRGMGQNPRAETRKTWGARASLSLCGGRGPGCDLAVQAEGRGSARTTTPF